MTLNEEVDKYIKETEYFINIFQPFSNFSVRDNRRHMLERLESSIVLLSAIRKKYND